MSQNSSKYNLSLHVSVSTCVCSVLAALIITMMVGTAQSKVNIPRNETIPAVIGFGDSIIDAGNNNGLKTLVKANFPPYGRDFDGGKPTGRFCNGKIPSDFVGKLPIFGCSMSSCAPKPLGDFVPAYKQLGIKDTVPAYLDPNLQPEDMTTGVTFASGGCGYDPLTSKLASVLTFSDQLTNFKEYIDKLKANVGADKASTIIAKSLYLVVGGSDDIANTYFIGRVRKLQYDVPSYTSLMASHASTFFKELYELGARRIAVFSAPPIGCVPIERTLSGGVVRGCAEEANQAAQLFNTKLFSAIDSLNSQLHGSKIVYVDIYNPLLDLTQNPKKYGLVYADKGCCSTGTIEVAVLCNQYDSGTCTDGSDYVFWDSYHPTEKAYRALIVPLMNKYINKFF